MFLRVDYEYELDFLKKLKILYENAQNLVWYRIFQLYFCEVFGNEKQYYDNRNLHPRLHNIYAFQKI